MTPEYAAALKVHDLAGEAYREALALYRAGKITDDAFLAARLAYKRADAAFDIAIDAEAARDTAAPLENYEVCFHAVRHLTWKTIIRAESEQIAESAALDLDLSNVPWEESLPQDAQLEYVSFIFPDEA